MTTSLAEPSGSSLSNFDSAAELEQVLGCPFDPDSGVSLAEGVHADELESVPVRSFEAAWAAGCHGYLVPVEEGGRLSSFEELLGMVRAMARRDVTIPVGFGSTLLAAMPVWLWGDETQRRRVAELVLSGGFGTAGISEELAGSDLLATAARADPVAGGFRLTGRKWLVGNGGRSAFATVLAASDPSFGLFLVDLAAIGSDGVERLPRVRTLGLRGHDLSGIEFRDCRLGGDARLGRPGRGIEMIAGMLPFTRTLVGGIALGATDTALRIAVRHARQRVLYGQPALALPPVRSLLAQGFADLLVGECTALAAARGLDVAAQRMPLWSAVAKYIVPAFCVDAISACGEVLSARGYLREGVAGGAFQKLARDAAILPVFEGTQLVQLETIRAQLTSGARRRGPAQLPLRTLFAFGAPVGRWAPRQTRPPLTYGTADEVVDLLDTTVERLSGDDELAALGRALVAVRDGTRDSLRELPKHRTHEAYDVARRHALVHAGACCLHTWVERRDVLGHLAVDRAWLTVALRRVVARLGLPVEPDRHAEDRLVDWLVQLDDDDRAFSLAPLRLAPQYRE